MLHYCRIDPFKILQVFAFFMGCQMGQEKIPVLGTNLVADKANHTAILILFPIRQIVLQLLFVFP